MRFELIGEIEHVETIASGRGVRDRRRLNREYGPGKWRKMKGIATIQLSDGTICQAELHWYEAHGIGKKELKFKKPIFIGDVLLVTGVVKRKVEATRMLTLDISITHEGEEVVTGEATVQVLP